MKRFRRLRNGLLVALVVLVVLFVGVRLYLSSRFAAAQAAERLQDVLGAPVQVNGIHVGIGGDSTLQGLEIFEEGKKGNGPWVTVEDVRADLSALSLVRGRTAPEEVDLGGAAIDLRFDKDGHLTTRLPRPKGPSGAYPRFRLENSQITLNQAGREPMVLQGVNADLTDGNGRLNARGTITDPFWGNWTVDGYFVPDQGELSLTLTTPHVPITMEKLKKVPFVSPDVWKQVKLEGAGSVVFNLHFRTQKPGVHYRVELQAQDTQITVPSIDLQANHASGRAVVEDGLVTLRDVRGQTADGEITTSGDLDFRKKPARLDFTNIEVHQVMLSKLPKEWPVPRQLDGRLTGKASLEVTLTEGKPHTQGTGQAQIRDALIAGFPTKRAITLRFTAEGKRFRFTPEGLSTGMAAPVTQVAFRPADGEIAQPLPESAGNWLPVRALEWLPRGAGLVARGVTEGATTVIRHLPNFDQAARADANTSYLEASFALEDVDLALLAQRLDLRLPFPIGGRLSVDVQLAIPIDTPRDLQAYRFRGRADLPRLDLAGLEMAWVHARVDYANGVLRLDELRGQLPPPRAPGPMLSPFALGPSALGTVGSFAGDARLEVEPPGNLTANLTVDRLPLDLALSLLPGAKGQAHGNLSGTLQGKVPTNRLGDPTAWAASGTLRSDRLQAYGLAAENVAATLAVAGGQARVSDFRADVEGAGLTGNGLLRLTGSYPFTARVDLAKANLDALQRLNPNLRPPVAIRGRLAVGADLKGTLSPPNFSVEGDARATDLQLDQFKIDSLSLRWKEAANGIQLNNVEARLYGGKVTGSASVPLRETAAGSLDLRIASVDAEALSKAVPGFPFPLEGEVSGSITGKLAAAPGKARELTTQVELTAPKLRVRGIPAEKLRGNVNYRAGSGDYTLEGELLGGKFKLEGKLPAQPEPPEKPKGPPQGRLRLNDVRLGRLWLALRLGDTLGPLHGIVSLDLPFHYGSDGRPIGDGVFEVRDLRWNGTDMASTVQGELRLTGTELQFRNVTGTVAGGTLRATVVFGLGPRGRSFFTLALEHADAAKLVTPFPGLAGLVRGSVEIRLRSSLGRQWNGGGVVVLERGRVFGIEINEWRLPLDFGYVPERGSGQVDVRDSGAQIAQGRATTRATLRWDGGGLRLEGHLRVIEANLRTLFGPGSELSSYAAGRVNARIDFGGSEIRSADDLTATIDASFQQTQAFQLPVLQALTPFIVPGQSATTFQRGDLRARLSRGVVRLQRLTLTNPTVQMIVEGNVTLGGRLNLDVTARTGTLGVNPNFLRVLGLKLPIAGPVPVALIAEVTSYLSNRVIHLTVTGTIRSPVVRVEPLSLLTEEAVRYFLERSNVPLP
jgi:hypothetical protein